MDEWDIPRGNSRRYSVEGWHAWLLTGVDHPSSTRWQAHFPREKDLPPGSPNVRRKTRSSVLQGVLFIVG